MTEEQRFLTPRATCAAAAVLTLMLGVVDWISGYELQFFVFYFIPIAFAAWSCGSRHGTGIAVLSTIVWYAADLFSNTPYSNHFFALWNTLIRLVAFLIFGFTISRIRNMLSEQHRISEDLRAALNEVKSLTGLLPICASCKKIRNDGGYWQQLEEYIEKHTNALFTHGLCDQCAAQALKDAGIELDIPAAAQAPEKRTITRE